MINNGKGGPFGVCKYDKFSAMLCTLGGPGWITPMNCIANI